MNIKVLIADDHKIIRDGLRALIEKQKDMKVVAEASNGCEAIEQIAETRPNIVVMDVSMPDLNGVEATRRIITANSQIKVIALSMHSDRRFVAEMLRAGASGYLLKDCAFEELGHAIRLVAKNRTYLSPGITDVVIGDYLKQVNGQEKSVFSVLTAREREILQLLAEGNTTKQIAVHCYVSVKTVETHRQHIMEKLDIHSLPELTKYALREGLTSLES